MCVLIGNTRVLETAALSRHPHVPPPVRGWFTVMFPLSGGARAEDVPR